MPCKATWGHTSFVQEAERNERKARVRLDWCFCGVTLAGQGPQLRAG